MSQRRELRLSEEIAHMAGDFFARQPHKGSLITVTHAELSPSFKEATIFFSVLPEAMEAGALKYSKRMRSDFREYIKEHSAFHPIPTVDFELDLGEKNRQRIDELTRRDKTI